jgi:hypothetical protein
MTRLALFSMIAFALTAAPHSLLPQSGAVEGSASTDSLGKHSMPGVEISIPALNITTQTNFAGEYHLGGILPGRYLMIATGVGRRSVGDSVTITAGGTVYHDFVLATKAFVLDSVVSNAAAPRKYISPTLNEFEERRTTGTGGYFVSEEQLRKDGGRQLSNEIAANIPGVKMTVDGTLLSGRTKCQGPALRGCTIPDCFVKVFVDGAPIYAPGDGSGLMPPPNFTRMQTDEYAGIEFYAGGATIPSRFAGPGAECGVLLLWTRER